MPFDGAYYTAQVNRQRLIRRLRDPETKTWWNFTRSSSCAMRICFEMTGRFWDPEAFGLTDKQAHRIFGTSPAAMFTYRRLFPSQVTPDMVADKLERIA